MQLALFPPPEAEVLPWRTSFQSAQIFVIPSSTFRTRRTRRVLSDVGAAALLAIFCATTVALWTPVIYPILAWIVAAP